MGWTPERRWRPCERFAIRRSGQDCWCVVDGVDADEGDVAAGCCDVGPIYLMQ